MGVEMTNSKERTDKASDVASFVFLLVGVILVLVVGYFLFSNLGNIRNFLREKDTYPLAISTAPGGATVFLDGQVVGKSPVTTLTFPGAHVVTVDKDGFQPQSHAFELSRDEYTSDKGWKRELIKKGSPWSYNFTLEAFSQAPVPDADAGQADLTRLVNLESQVKDVRSLILANPEQALSYGVLKGRVENLEKEIEALREQAQFSNGLTAGLWAILVSVFLTLAALVFGRRKSAA